MDKDQKLETLAKGIFSYLKTNIPEDKTAKIIEKLKKIFEKESAIAEVTTSVALTDEEENIIKEYLHKNFGNNFSTRFFIDKRILGGIRIKVGDILIDRSFEGILSQIEERLKA